MSEPWNELQRELYTLISPIINFQIHCANYSANGECGNADLLQYWITLDEEIIWDFPAQFIGKDGKITNKSGTKTWDRYTRDVSDISDIIRQYIDTPEDKIFTDDYDEHWGLIDILQSADRRCGISPRSESLLAGNDAGKVTNARLKASERYSLGYDFCLFLEFRLSYILENCMTDAEKSGFWCDGVVFDSMIDNKTALCRADIVKGQTEWQKFYLILHLEKTSSSLWPGESDLDYLKERVCNVVQVDTVSVDISQKTIHFNLN